VWQISKGAQYTSNAGANSCTFAARFPLWSDRLPNNFARSAQYVQLYALRVREDVIEGLENKAERADRIARSRKSWQADDPGVNHLRHFPMWDSASGMVR
jgi:hypothetical protein